MILVDIYVPSVDKEYDFSLNETVTVQTIIEEITEMIGRKEQTFLVGDIRDVNLCDKKNGTILPLENTLSDCGVRTGASLMLI